MAIYKIIEVPDPILKKTAQPVKKINAGVLRVLDNLRDTMYDANGVGLAAPQIGVSRRLAVIDIGDGSLLELINPEIIRSEGKQIGGEGCLSIPGVVGSVERAQKVTVRSLNRNGELFDFTGEDLMARALQHEIDHLDGIIFTMRAEDLTSAD